VRVWAEEMCQNNAWLQSLGGDPQEHQHPPVGIEFPDLPGADCVHKFHDGPTYGYSYTWKLFERLVKQRPIDILYETPGRELIQHELGHRHRSLCAALGAAKLVTNPDLNGVVTYRQPAAQELDIAHPQHHGFAPTDTGVSQCEHQRPMLARLGRQPGNVVDGEIHAPLTCLVRRSLTS